MNPTFQMVKKVIELVVLYLLIGFFRGVQEYGLALLLIVLVIFAVVELVYIIKNRKWRL